MIQRESRLVRLEDLARVGIDLPAQQPADRTQALSNRRALVAFCVEHCLSPRQKKIMQLYLYRQYTMQEIAQALHVNKSTICRHIARSKERIAQLCCWMCDFLQKQEITL